MRHPLLLLAASLACLASTAFAQHAHGPSHAARPSPYAADTGRDIKALSAEEQRAWEEGQGAGLARAAELNRHPGPMHVLEHARELGLTAQQERQARELMERHKAEVRTLGRELVALERQLDRLFAQRQAGRGEEAARLAEAIGTLAGRIRGSHLRTHAEQALLLSEAQVATYQRLRGYAP